MAFSAFPSENSPQLHQMATGIQHQLADTIFKKKYFIRSHMNGERVPSTVTQSQQ